MRSYAEEKLGKLDRFSDQIIDAKVVMSYAQDNSAPAKVEVQLNVPNGIVRAEESGQDPYAAVDMVVDKLERQLKRFKGKMMAKRTQDEPPPPAGPCRRKTTSPSRTPRSSAPNATCSAP